MSPAFPCFFFITFSIFFIRFCIFIEGGVFSDPKEFFNIITFKDNVEALMGTQQALMESGFSVEWAARKLHENVDDLDAAHDESPAPILLGLGAQQRLALRHTSCRQGFSASSRPRCQAHLWFQKTFSSRPLWTALRQSMLPLFTCCSLHALRTRR